MVQNRVTLAQDGHANKELSASGLKSPLVNNSVTPLQGEVEPCRNLRSHRSIHYLLMPFSGLCSTKFKPFIFFSSPAYYANVKNSKTIIQFRWIRSAIILYPTSFHLDSK